MELRQMRYALRIAEEQSFSRAAEKLHIAQPSLSQQLSKLERELGVLLFNRNTSSVELTHAGRTFVEKARKIIDAAEQLKQEMEDISQMKKGRLVVGSLPMTGSHILPQVLPVFQSRYPDIEVAVVEETTAHLEELTAQGQTDICLLSLPLTEKTLDFRPVIDEEILLAVPPGHRLLQSKPTGQPLPLTELQDEPFIVLKRGQGFRQLTLELCEEAGFTPRIVFESTNIETIQSLVAVGMGVAFTPKMVTRERSGRYAPAYLPLESRPYRTLVMAFRRGRYLSKAAEAFMTTLMEVVREP